MKMYTNSEQTAKLIELGFGRPKFEIETQLCNVKGQTLRAGTIVGDYSIGELIEMLPDEIYVDKNTYSKVIDKTDVCYYSWELETYAISICDVQEELIDNLFDMCVRLKEEGMI